MRNFLLLLVLIFCFAFPATPSKAQKFPYPHESRVKGLIHIFEAKLSSTVKIKDIYGLIDSDGPIYAYQIWCRAEIMANGGDVKRKVFWPVWFRPEVWVDRNVECVDAVKSPWVLNIWMTKLYRPILSNAFEAHTDLIYLYQRYSPYSDFRWCKSNHFGYETYDDADGSYILSPRMDKVIFSWKYATSLAFVYTSRDVVCTNDVSEYNRWKRNRWWREIG